MFVKKWMTIISLQGLSLKRSNNVKMGWWCYQRNSIKWPMLELMTMTNVKRRKLSFTIMPMPRDCLAQPMIWSTTLSCEKWNTNIIEVNCKLVPLWTWFEGSHIQGRLCLCKVSIKISEWSCFIHVLVSILWSCFYFLSNSFGMSLCWLEILLYW